MCYLPVMPACPSFSKLLSFTMQVQLSELSQMPCSPKTKCSNDQIRNTADCEIAVLFEPKAAYSTLRRSLQMKLPQISRLEQLAAAASIRELDARRAVAVLCGKHMRYFVTSTAIDLGRSTNTLGKVSLLLSVPPTHCHSSTLSGRVVHTR